MPDHPSPRGSARPRDAALGARRCPRGSLAFFLPEARQSTLSADGHPTRGGFLPPVDLPRRMWAGGRLDFLAPIPFGSGTAKHFRAEGNRRKKIHPPAGPHPARQVDGRQESSPGRMAVRAERRLASFGQEKEPMT